MTERIEKIIAALWKEYPTAKCALVYKQPHELLIATRLSAQCTDKRVNLVTPTLFEKFPTVAAFAEAGEDEVAEIIKTCGLFRTKAHDIVEMCRALRRDYGGIVPDNMEALLSLPGVGRKTANLIIGELYGKPAYVCDTHTIRLSNRLGLAEGTDAAKVEKALREIIPAEKSLGFCHRLVTHGRIVCTAKSPKCEECCLKGVCKPL